MTVARSFVAVKEDSQAFVVEFACISWVLWLLLAVHKRVYD